MSEINHYKIGRSHTAQLEPSDVRYYVRYTQRGIVLVTTYPDPDDYQTMVEVVIGGRRWIKWYDVVVATPRAASMLVHRFLAEIDAVHP